MSRPIYMVKATRAGRWWGLTVPDVPGAVSQVRTLAQADEYAREAIAFVLDVGSESFDLDVVPDLPADLARRVRAARSAAADVQKRQQAAAALSREVVAGLKAAGLTGADTAAVLGLSPQRVSQLAERKPAAAKTTTRGRTWRAV